MAGNLRHANEVRQQDSSGDESTIITTLLDIDMILYPQDYEFCLKGEVIGSDVLKASVILTAYSSDPLAHKPIIAAPLEFYEFKHHSGEMRRAFNLGDNQAMLENIFNANKNVVTEDPEAVGQIFINYREARIEFPSPVNRFSNICVEKFWLQTVELFTRIHAAYSIEEPNGPTSPFQFEVAWKNLDKIQTRMTRNHTKVQLTMLPQLRLSHSIRNVTSQENQRAFLLALKMRQGDVYSIASLIRKLKYDSEVKCVFRHLNRYAESKDIGVRQHSRKIESLLIHAYLMVQFNHQVTTLTRPKGFKTFEKFCEDYPHELFVKQWFVRQQNWLDEKMKPVLAQLEHDIVSDEFTLGAWGSRRTIMVNTDAGMVEKPIPHGFYRIFQLLQEHHKSGNTLKTAHGILMQSDKRATHRQGKGTMLFKGEKRIRTSDTVGRYEDTRSAIKSAAEQLGPMGGSVMSYQASKKK